MPGLIHLGALRTWLLIPGLTFILVFGGLFFPLNNHYTSHFLDTRIEKEAARVSDILYEYRFMLNGVYLKRLGKVIEGQIALIDHEGRIMAASFDRSAYDGFSAIVAPNQLLSRHHGRDDKQMIRKVESGDRVFLLVSRRLIISPTIPPIFSAILTPLDDLEKAKKQIFLRMIYIAGLSLLAAMFVAGVLLRKIGVFLGDILRVTQKIASGTFGGKVPLSQIKELDLLAGSINKMSDKLQEYEKKIVSAVRYRSTSKIMAAMAHEIKNPLASMKMLAQIMKRNFGPDADPARTADALIKEIDRVDRLVSDLNTMTRPSKYDFAPHFPETPLNEILPLIRPKLDHLNICLECDIASHTMDIPMDKDRIKQVLWNLMVNAAESMPQGGRMRVAMTQNQKTGRVDYQVTDTGPGVDEKEIETLFKPFFTTKKEGIGIGLHVSRQIAAAHKGILELENTGSGTCAILSIP